MYKWLHFTTRNQAHRHEGKTKPAGSCGGYFFPKLSEYNYITTGAEQNAEIY